MKNTGRLTLIFLLAALGTVRAQWRTESYALTNVGWHAIWLPGDASYQSVADHVKDNPSIAQIWRWDARANTIQFATDPTEFFSAADQWAVWSRTNSSQQTLDYLLGNTPYLVQVTAPTTWNLKYRVEAPAAPWQTTGANLLGFPAAGNGTSGNSPSFSAYFNSLVFGGSRGLPSSTKIYKYVGGDMARNVNPMSIPSTALIDPRAAYWITLPSATDYTGPVEYELPGGALDFGRTGTAITLGVKNRTTSALTLTLALETSESAPSGQPSVAGNVPLVIRRFADGAYTDQPLTATASQTVQLPASSTTEILLAVDRSAMTGSSSDAYASILKLTDSSKLTLSRLPVRAQPASAAGLWACLVTLNQVVNLVPNDGSGSATSRDFTFKYLVHIDDGGTMCLLRNCFLGQLKSTHSAGLAIKESEIYAEGESEADPRRFFSPMLPASVPYVESSGAYAKGSTVTWGINHAANDAVNPFRHAYHPDHPNGLDLTRTVTMTFPPAPPEDFPGAASLSSVWGTSVLGGTYNETIEGLNSQPITTSGTFLMQRLSEISTINLKNP